MKSMVKLHCNKIDEGFGFVVWDYIRVGFFNG